MAHKLGQYGAALISAIPLVLIAFNIMYGFFINLGGTIVNNDAFFAQWFVNPIFQMPSFLFGVSASLLYVQYLEERKREQDSSLS